jgi:two-component system, sensor histidine kinase and response regulator
MMAELSKEFTADNPANASLLVIDDEPGIRQGCKRALTPQGYHVDIAADGDEGLEKFRTGHYELVLIDVMMPGVNGIELITRIHEQDPDTVCVIITGYATVELAVSAIKQGAYDFLTKPFTSDELLHVVEQGLERRRLSLESQRLQVVEAEARRLEEERARLEELDRVKASFIRLVTHELQAPVNAIITYLDLIQSGYIEPEEQQQYLGRCQERATELRELIADLLRYGRLKETGASELTESVQVDAALRQVIEQFEPQAVEKGLTLRCEIAPDLSPVRSTVEQVRSLWQNLVSNAIKYTPEGGKVAVDLRQEGGWLVGEVKDNGIGIPQEAMGRLFGEFFRARNARALNIPGSGLGLAIVRQVIDRIGGEIEVQSPVEGVERGTTFRFRLPVYADQ